MIVELAHHIWIVPLLWLAGLRVRGHKLHAGWWWIAAGYGMSWLANTAAHWVDPDFAGNLYPVFQSALIGYAFLVERDRAIFLVTLLVVGIVAVIWRGPFGVDVLVYTVAYGGVVGIVFDRWALGRLRLALLVTFGLGLLAWWAYALHPWTFWTRSDSEDMVFLVSNLGFYHVVSAIGLGLFCWAALKPGPSLQLAKP